MRNRATAIIIKDEKILLFRRIKKGLEYFIFPGGGVEENETTEEALKREVGEELSLEISKWKHLFDMEVNVPPVFLGHAHQKYFLYLIEEYTGTPEIGGPEKEANREDNQFHLVWIPIINLSKMDNLYPKEIISKLNKHHK